MSDEPAASPASGTSRRVSPDTPIPSSDAELTGALLEVYRYIDLSQQLRVLLEHAMYWSGAGLGFAFGPGEDRRLLVPIAGSVPEEDPRYRALQELGATRLTAWLEEATRPLGGLGPFAPLAELWPGDPAGANLSFRVRPVVGGTVGYLWLIFDEPPVEEQTERVEQLLEMSRPALANALQVRAMRELVIKDDTAHCFNRRYFEEFLPEELSRASRFRAPLSLIFLDLDNLKQVNSELGHAMGSRTLFEVSVRVRAKIRKFDKLFRFGGDEFCIVLPETEWHGALEVAERVRESIANQPFLAHETDSQGVQMTASFGIASFPLHARTKEGLIQQADRAMQRIKKGRKNSVGVAEIVGEQEHGS